MHYIEDSLQVLQTITLPDAIAHHIGRVLRLRDGDFIELFNGDGHIYKAAIQWNAEKSHRRTPEVQATIKEAVLSDTESPLQLTLLQGLSSAEKFSFSIEKCTELGMTTLIPVQCQRSVSLVNEEKQTKKQEHWRNIAIAAAAQCGRARLPEFHSVIASSDEETLATICKEHSACLVLDPLAALSLKQTIGAWEGGTSRLSSIAVLVGPEGGLTVEEISTAIKAGFSPVSLGPRILRTETAGPALFAAVQALLGDF